MKTTTFVMQRTARHASNRDQIAATPQLADMSAIKGTGVSADARDLTYDPTGRDFFGNDLVGKNIPTRSATGSPPG